MGLMEKLVDRRRSRFVRELMSLLGLEVPAGVSIGVGFQLQHRGRGTVINPNTTIGNRVTIYHNVTIGRADSYRPVSRRALMDRIVIGDDVTLLPGCVVLGREGVTTVGRGTVVGANSVLSQSTGEREIWAGSPARCVGQRDPSDFEVLHSPSEE